jgi:hypothetical protein
LARAGDLALAEAEDFLRTGVRLAEAAEAIGLLAARDFLELLRVIFFLGDISEVYHHVRNVNNAPSHRLS